MFGNEFRCAKTKVFNPSGLNMAAAWLRPMDKLSSYKVQEVQRNGAVMIMGISLKPGFFSGSVCNSNLPNRASVVVANRGRRRSTATRILSTNIISRYWNTRAMLSESLNRFKLDSTRFQQVFNIFYAFNHDLFKCTEHLVQQSAECMLKQMLKRALSCSAWIVYTIWTIQE